jgi:hypothetical protein
VASKDPWAAASSVGRRASDCLLNLSMHRERGGGGVSATVTVNDIVRSND